MLLPPRWRWRVELREVDEPGWGCGGWCGGRETEGEADLVMRIGGVGCGWGCCGWG